MNNTTENLTVPRPFFEAENTHQIGKFVGATFDYLRKITLSTDEQFLEVRLKGTGDFATIEKRYQINEYVRIRFVLEPDGFHYVKLQSARHPDALTEHRFTGDDRGIALCPKPNTPVLYFIGADDIRPARICTDAWGSAQPLTREKTADKLLLLKTVFVAQGGVVEIRHDSTENALVFRCNNFQLTPP